MNKKKFFKVFALVNFISLMIVFLCFKKGYFDTYLYAKKPLPEIDNKLKAKSIVQIKKIPAGNNKEVYFSSSKSIIINDDRRSNQKVKIIKDTFKKELSIFREYDLLDSTNSVNTDSININSSLQNVRMFSTKSGMVINLNDIKPFLFQKKKKKKWAY